MKRTGFPKHLSMCFQIKIELCYFSSWFWLMFLALQGYFFGILVWLGYQQTFCRTLPLLIILENVLGIYQVWEEVMSYIKRFASDYWIGTLNINVTKLGDIQSRTRVYFFLLRRDVAKVTSHGRFQSLLNRTLQNIYAEYKGRTCSRKLVQHGLCVFSPRSFDHALGFLGICILEPGTPYIQTLPRNGILFEDDHPLVLADETRRSKGRIGEFRDLNPSNPVPKKPKWIGKNMRMMKALKAGY